MAAYAPLFGNLTALHWSPDLIWFNNNTVTSSVNYYVQKIFAKNAGTTLLKSDMSGATVASKPFAGKVGVGTWNTAAKFDNAKVVSNDTGKILGKDTFTKAENFSKYWEKACLRYFPRFGACRCFQALLFQQLAVCLHFVPIQKCQISITLRG